MASSYPLFQAIEKGMFTIFLKFSTASFFFFKPKKNIAHLFVLHGLFFALFFQFKKHIALRGNGLKIMILLRLSPLIPYNALDYLSGVTAIPLGAYSMAMFGMIPGIVMFCYIGATASSLTEGTSGDHNKPLKIVSLVFGVTFAIIGFATATYYSKLELDRVRYMFVFFVVNLCGKGEKKESEWIICFCFEIAQC